MASIMEEGGCPHDLFFLSTDTKLVAHPTGYVEGPQSMFEAIVDRARVYYVGVCKLLDSREPLNRIGV